MKKTVIYAFLLFSLNCMAQTSYNISLLDSINNTSFNQGVFGLSAAEHGGVIHLSYFYGSQDANFTLIHETRNNGQQLSLEVAHDFSSNSIDRSSKTAIQFDENGQIYIYCAYRIPDKTKLSVFTKSDQWESVDLDYTPHVYYVHASANGQDQPGFISHNKYFKDGHYMYQVDYFEPVDGIWAQETIFSSKYTKSNPCCYHASNGETYIAFVEGHHPDTTALYIFMKDQNEWVLDYHAIYENQVSFIGELAGYVAGVNYNYFGEFDSQVHLIHNMDNQSGKESGLTHLVKTDHGWEKLDLSNPGDYAGNGRFNGSELEFASDGTLYWVDNSAAIRYIKPNQEYKAFDVPLKGASYWDYVVIDDELVIYYSTGDNAYPWGDDLKFYEATTDLSNMASGVRDVNISVNDMNIYPNPGNGRYNLQINASMKNEIELEWIDIFGRSISDSKKYVLAAGNQIIELKPKFENRGLYFLKIHCKGEKPVCLSVFKK